jgi:uncharacterized membrane protein
LSVNTAVLLAVISIAFLIYFVNHIARSIQAETIIARVTRDALEVVDHLFPEQLGEAAEDETPDAYARATGIPVIAAPRSGFLQNVDPRQLMAFAVAHDVVLKLEHRIGSFIIEGDPLLSITAGAVPSLPGKQLAGAFVIGSERTRYQDVERGLIELTDIAVRALSPGINDPTTAVACIHRLTEIFTKLGARRFPAVARQGEDGVVRMLAPRSSFAELLDLAYGPIVLHGRANPVIIAAVESSLQRLLERLPEFRHEAIIAVLDRLRLNE